MSFRKLPYGYRLERGTIAVVEEEATIIRAIFKGRSDGKSTRKMAKELHDIPYFSDITQNASCKISKILYNARYIGAEGYPPIVEMNVFEQVQALRGKSFNPKHSVRRAGGRAPSEMQPLPDSTLYFPSKDVFDAEKVLKTEMRSENADADTIRTMIMNLASLKYDCIS